jgi:esterase/lipase superfamily enzyme
MQKRRKAMFSAAITLIVLGGGGWIAIQNSGLVQPAHWQPPSASIPVISTRGSLRNGKLTAGHTAYDYHVENTLPGFTAGTAPPGDLILVLHGFNNTAEKALYKFGIAKEALESNHYAGVVAGYSWDADTQWDPLAMTGYHEGLRNATANGTMLARFIVDYKTRNPQTRVHLLGYSMGAKVALETLLALQQDRQCAYPGVAVASVQLVGASISNEDVELGKRYGTAISLRCGVLYNYYSPEDNKLTYYFPIKEGKRALGMTDILHPAHKPSNYIGVNVQFELPKISDTGAIDTDEYGDNHSGYLGTRNQDGKLIDDGVMNLVARNIAALSIKR